MARVNVPIQTPLGPFPELPVAADALDVAFTNGDASNGNEFTATGSDLLLVKNTGGVARTITFLSVADQFNRTGNVTAYSIGAGETIAFYFGTSGWRQTTGKIHIDVEHADLKLAVLSLSVKFAQR